MNYQILRSLLEEAEELILKGNFLKVETLTNELLKQLEQINEVGDIEIARQNDELRCAALIALSTAKRSKGDLHASLTHARASVELAETKNLTNETKAKAVGNLGNVYQALSDYPQALINFQKALAINEEIGNKDGIASNIGSIGIVYAHLSDFTQALRYFQKALTIYEEIGKKEGLSRNLGSIGNVYSYLSDYAEALRYFQMALAINENIGNKNGIATNLCNIGIAYQHLSDYTQALTYFQKSLAIFEEIGNKNGIATNLVNIGNTYSYLLEYVQSLAYHKKAHALSEEVGSKEGIARNLGNIGNVYMNLSDYSQALICFQKALVLNEEIDKKDGIAIILGNIGRLHAKKQFEAYNEHIAEEYMQRAIALSEDFGDKKNLYDYHLSLATLYEAQERWKEHSIQFKKYHSLKEEVQSEEATKQSQILENRRKVEEAERDRQVKLARFQEQEKILHNILPVQIADRILEGEKQIADYCENVSIFFSDIVGFTKLSQHMPPHELVSMLNEVFSEFDRIARKHGLEKIKTIGDAYMAVAGLPVPQENHAERAALFALEVMQWMEDYRTRTGNDLHIRAGLHCGHAVAGVIGENKFAYDLWGDAVNTASRMESHGEPGKIQVSDDFRKKLGEQFVFEERGETELKGRGMMKTHFLNQ